MKKYYYFYKITNLINSHYYGIHSTNDLDDHYMGSGDRLKIWCQQWRDSSSLSIPADTTLWADVLVGHDTVIVIVLRDLKEFFF